MRPRLAPHRRDPSGRRVRPTAPPTAPPASVAPARPPGPELDLNPLEGRVGPWARLRALGGEPRMVVAATLGVLLLVVPTALLVGVVGTGNDLDGGGVAVGALLVAGGLWVVLDLYVSAGAAGAVRRFARVNDLVLLSGIAVPHYASRVFAGGSHLVSLGVRTRDEAFLEVGDRFPAKVPRRADEAYGEPSLYLRARIAGRAGTAPYGASLVTPDLEERLTELAGEHTVEVTGDELTVLGTAALGPTVPGRVEQAFALVHALAARADELLVHPGAEGPTTSGIPVPDLSVPEVVEGRSASPLTVVVLTLALMIILPTALAVVMSNVEGSLRGNELGATVAVSLIVALVFFLAALLMRTVSKPRRSRRGGRRR